MTKISSWIYEWTLRIRIPLYFLVGVSIAAGFITDRFIGGPQAYYAGRFQAGVLIVFLFYTLTLLLFKPHGPGITKFLQSWPGAGLRLFTFIFGAAFTIFCVRFFIVTADSSSPDISTKHMREMKTNGAR